MSEISFNKNNYRKSTTKRHSTVITQIGTLTTILSNMELSCTKSNVITVNPLLNASLS